MTPRRVLITGATGCVGRYIVDDLLSTTDSTLLLLVRDPEQLPARILESPRVSILRADLRAASHGHQAALGPVDVALLAAACWGPDPDAHDVNVRATLELAGSLAGGRCQHLIHFATASLLGHDHAPLEEAVELGTPYIQSKAECARALRQGASGLPVTILYPTLVVGGGERGIRRSHFSNLLVEIARRRALVRFVRATGSFHAIHASDIARVVSRLVDDVPPPSVRELVLGGAAVTVDAAIDALCTATGVRRMPLLPLNPALAGFCIRAFRIRLESWDRFCLQRAHFTHETPIMPEDLGARSSYPTFASLADFALQSAPR